MTTQQETAIETARQLADLRARGVGSTSAEVLQMVSSIDDLCLTRTRGGKYVWPAPVRRAAGEYCPASRTP